MENKSNKKLTYEEYNRVLDCIYDFCKKLDIQNVQKNMWKLDFFTSNKDDQIMVQRISNRAEKINENIIGGYTAVLPFYINFQSGAKTEKSVKTQRRLLTLPYQKMPRCYPRRWIHCPVPEHLPHRPHSDSQEYHS